MNIYPEVTQDVRCIVSNFHAVNSPNLTQNNGHPVASVVVLKLKTFKFSLLYVQYVDVWCIYWDQNKFW